MFLQGIYYLLSLIAFGVIAMWFMQNDRLPPGERTKGFLRMKDAISADADMGKKAERSADVPH